MKILFETDDGPLKKRLWLLATLPFFFVTILMGLMAPLYWPGGLLSVFALLLALYGLAVPRRFPKTVWIRRVFILSMFVAFFTVLLEAFWLMGGCKLAGDCI